MDCNNNCGHIFRNINRCKPASIVKSCASGLNHQLCNGDKQDENINPFIFQFPPLSPRLFTHKRLLQCCDNLFAVYVRPATENAARGLKAETAGSLTSLSGPGRYPDRKQLDAPLNTTLKNTWAENAKATGARDEPVENLMDFSRGGTTWRWPRRTTRHSRNIVSKTYCAVKKKKKTL